MHAPTPRAILVGALVFVIFALLEIAALAETLIHHKKNHAKTET